MPGLNDFEDFKSLVRQHSDVVDVIGAYVPLKQQNGRYVACCPFHKEKTPSFYVSAERQSYHCFGCQKGGDVFSFVMEYEHVDFPTALKILADRAHIALPKRRFDGAANGARTSSEPKDRLYAIYEQLTAFYQKQLLLSPNSVVALYLGTRALDRDTVARFRIGAAPDAWSEGIEFLRRQGFSDAEIKLSGVAIESEKNPNRMYDRFRNRLMFPIWNEFGRVVAFSARQVLEDKTSGKYINSPETPVFKKGNVLYAYALARPAIANMQYVIVCEGQLDVIAMHRAGFENTVAPQGTAFTHEQAQLLRRITDRLYIALDSDKAGRAAALRVMQIALELDFEVKVVHFPGGKDPDELYRNAGKEEIHRAVNEAADFLTDAVAYYRAQRPDDAESPAGTTWIAQQVLPLINCLQTELKQTAYIAALASMLNVRESSLMNRVRSMREQARKEEEKRAYFKQQREAAESNELQRPAVSDAPIYSERVRVALQELFFTALSNEGLARKLAASLSPEILPDALLSRALNGLLAITLNGEWVNRFTFLQEFLREVQDAVQLNASDETARGYISSLLVESTEKMTFPRLEKSCEESLYTLQESAAEDGVKAALNAWKNALTQDEQAVCREAYSRAQQVLRQVRATRFAEREAAMIKRNQPDTGSIEPEKKETAHA